VAQVELARAEEFDRALGEVSRSRPQALFIINTAVTVTHRARIVDFALKNRVSLVGTQRGWAEAGALMDYSASITGACRRAAVFVDKILKGAKPSDLPVEQPTKFELVINLKTAKALGLTIPPSLLLRPQGVAKERRTMSTETYYVRSSTPSARWTAGTLPVLNGPRSAPCRSVGAVLRPRLCVRRPKRASRPQPAPRSDSTGSPQPE
jgi:hypothetical protein